MRIARGLLLAALLICYAALMHHVNASGQASLLGAVLAVLPVLAIGLAMVRNADLRIAGIVLLVLTSAIAWQLWPQIARHSGFIFWVQDICLMLLLMLTFGRTLLPGRKPLCVHFAEMMHGQIPAEHTHYARRVTIAWTLFFAVMAIVSSLLYFFAPLAAWSVFAYFLTLPLVALMFVVEYMLRRRVLVDVPDSSIFDAMRAYLDKSARAH